MIGWREIIEERMEGIQNVFLIKYPPFLATERNNYLKQG